MGITNEKEELELPISTEDQLELLWEIAYVCGERDVDSEVEVDNYS